MADRQTIGEVFDDSDNRIITDSTLIKVGERYYETRSILPNNFTIIDQFNTDKIAKDQLPKIEPNIAYLIGDYFYLYRGKISDVKPLENPLPGIYLTEDGSGYIFCQPETDEEKQEYRYSDKITTYDADEIREAVLNHDVIIMNVPDVVHSNIPPEDINDDILKRGIKRALLKKGIDLDQCRARFFSKNMLFNFKSVIRGDNRLSMLLFERGTEALNLKYTIILEEAGGEIVGKPLTEPICISSEDVYDTSLVGTDHIKNVEDDIGEYEPDDDD